MLLHKCPHASGPLTWLRSYVEVAGIHPVGMGSASWSGIGPVILARGKPSLG